MSSVPDTTDFSLADVVAAVLPSSNDLVECFDDADDGAFDSSYGPGDESNLLQFRNYGNVIAAQNEVYITTNSPVSPGAACSANRTVLAWKNRNPNSVSNGDKFWEDDNGSPGDPYPGGGEVEFFGAFTGLNSSSFKLSSLGIVSNVANCNTSLTLTDVYYSIGGGSFSTPVDYYYSSTIGNASNLSAGDILYTDTALTTEVSIPVSIKLAYRQDGSAASTTIAGVGVIARIVLYENNGVIQAIRSF
jgi:hypothetical protein